MPSEQEGKKGAASELTTQGGEEGGKREGDGGRREGEEARGVAHGPVTVPFHFMRLLMVKSGS